MGLFGSSDDTEDEGDRAGDDGAGDGGDQSADERTEAEVSALVDPVLNARGTEQVERLGDLVSRLEGPTQERITGARAIGRVAQREPDALSPDADRIIDQLAGRELAGPIAEALLGGAHDLSANGVAYDGFAEGALDALVEAEHRIDEVRLAAGEVPGGGASEVALGMELRDYADTVSGREQLVVETTADALEAVPRTLARQAGVDPIDAVVDMRSKVFGDEFVGIDTETGAVRDATESGMTIPESDLRLRITDGITLGTIVCCTRGTVNQLEALTGHQPHPEYATCPGR